MKRRIISFLLVGCLLSMCVPQCAFAEESESHGEESIATNEDSWEYSPVLITGEPANGPSFKLEDIQKSPLCIDETTYSLSVSRYFRLDDLGYWNINSEWVEYEVQQGADVTLEIVESMWSPHTCRLQIGILRVDGPDAHCVEVTGGGYCNTLLFSDLNAGNYIVYVRNITSQTVTDGAIRYSIS